MIPVIGRGAGRLGPGDVGQRVVVRFRLADGRASDVLGQLTQWDSEHLWVRDRYDELHRIAQADIVAAKVIGPPPQRRARPEPS